MSPLLFALSALAQDPTGELYVVSDPAGAAISLDGADTGKVTPSMLVVPPGEHVVVVTTGCNRGEATISVKAGLIARAEPQLAPGPATLDVKTEPAGALVLIDGVEKGPSPLVVTDAPCGAHELVLRAEGFFDLKKAIDLRAHETVTIDEKLAELVFGTLVVSPTPLEAKVSLDGAERGAGPMTLEQIPVGPHELVVTAEGFATDVRTVTIERDAVARADVVLVVPPPPKKFPAVRVGANSAVTAGGVVLGILAVHNLRVGKAAYQAHLDETDEARRQEIYDRFVIPAYTNARWEGIGAIAVLAGAGAMWATTDFSVGLTPTSVTASVAW